MANTYVAPYAGRMQVPYGYGTYLYKRSNGSTHKGIDIVGLDSKEVRATIGGKVTQSRMVTDKTNATWEWGNYVTILGTDGLYHFYCHLASRAVSVGDTVKAGQKIGVEGNTGNAALNNPPYTHLHYEVRKTTASGSHTNPCGFAGISNAAGTYGAPIVVDDSGKDTDTGASIAEIVPGMLRIYGMNRAQENPADINTYVLGEKKKQEQVALSVTAGGDGKRRAGHSRSPAREYTAENRNDILAQQVAEMGLDEALVQCDGEKTRLWRLEPVGESHTEAITAACASPDPVALRSPNAAGTGDSQWYVGYPIRAVDGTGAAQVESLLAYLDNPENKLLPGNYLIGG